MSACLLAVAALSSQVLAEFRAGASARNIDPKTFPVWVNGGIAGHQVDRIRESLFVRSIVLEDGKTKIAISIVDNCLLPHEITDEAKRLVEEAIGVPASNILIAATHNHSSVSVMGAHGCPPQEDYAAELPKWIAEGIVEADKRLQPAQMGTASVMADKYIYCRDWLMAPGTAYSVPFTGREYDLAQMNPGHDNVNKRAPVSAIDRLVTILSIQDRSGKPLAMLSSFGTHYAGAAAISSDYFGFVAHRLAHELRPDAPEEFIGIMANGTSGNANCIDFSKPAAPFNLKDVGNYVCDLILSQVESIQYDASPDIGVAFDSFDVAVRMPSEKDVKEAKDWIKINLQDRLPQSMIENYARETVLLSEMPPTRRMNLQVFRLGDFAMVANPCETYGSTGLKIRQASPFSLTMHIGLANGHCGYIPPPEMFQLGSYTTWRCRTSCLEEQAEPKMVEAISKLLVKVKEEADLKKKVTSKEANGQDSSKTFQSPVSPQESLELLKVEDGYEVELAVAEPLVVDPIAMSIDAQGQVWVVEMGDYPNASAEHVSQVVILTDKDADGVLDTRRTFANNLKYATGVQPWKDGAFVTVEGALLLIRDTDNDGVADKTETWLQGFSAGNPQLRANHPTITPDGWLTIAGGLRLGKVATGSDFPFESQEVDATGGDVRFHLVSGKLEAITGPTQYGLAFDMVGNRFGCSNRHPCFLIQLDRKFASMGPLAGRAPSLRNILPAEANSKVFALVDAWTTSNLHAGQFTAACGLTLLQGADYPQCRTMDFFTCEPTGSLVQRREVKRTENGLVMTPVPDSYTTEFLASYDPWFRPVDLYVGPGNQLYVIDMYRAVIEHPEWVPEELQHRPDERFGDNLGRIYTVRDKAQPSLLTKLGSLSELTLADATHGLLATDRWLQQQAIIRLLEEMTSSTKAGAVDPSPKGKIGKQLRDVVRVGTQQGNVSAVCAAAQLLAAAGLTEADDIAVLLKSPVLEFNIVGLQILRQLESAELLKNLQPAVLSQLSSSSRECIEGAAWCLALSKNLGNQVELRGKEVQTLIQRLVNNDDDQVLWLATSALFQDSLGEMLSSYLQTMDEIHETSSTSGASLGTQGSSVENDRLALLSSRAAAQPSNLAEFQKLLNEAKNIASSVIEKANEKGVATRKLNAALSLLSGAIGTLPGERGASERFFESLVHIASESHNSTSRTLAVRILGQLPQVPSEKADEALYLCGQSGVTSLEVEAVNALARRNSDGFGDWICNSFGTASTPTRNAMFAQALSTGDRLDAFVTALERNKISSKLLDPIQLQNLAKVEPPVMRERVTKLLDQLQNKDREKVVQDYQKAMSGMEVGIDPSIGKNLFAKHCASCHQLDNIGSNVGPDVSDSRIHSYEKLLISVLDPNRSIDANYFRYMAQTEDGQTVEGLLKEANAQTVVLESQNGNRVVLQRDELLDFKSSGVSMMPDGFEQQLNPREMAELLWYIKNWRYVASGVPATAKLP